MVKTGSLYLTWGESVLGCDRRTDRIPIASMRSAVPAGAVGARKN